MRRGSPFLSADYLTVRLKDGLRIAIPSWMLDPILCDQLKEEDSPHIAISALLSLCDLVDSQPLLSAAESCSSGPQKKGGSDATEQEDTCKNATNPTLRPKGYLEASSKRAARSVPGSSEPAAPRSDPMRSKIRKLQ